MQHAVLDKDKAALSVRLHKRLCECGFTTERVQLQSYLVDHLEELYKDLYDQDKYSWFIAGSYGDVWGNNLFTMDGRTDEHESDIDWTCLMKQTVFHFKESCKCGNNEVDMRYVLSEGDVSEGHVRFQFEYLREPAEPHNQVGMRPKVDECTAYRCCSIPIRLLREEVRIFGNEPEILASQTQLIQASRPGHESLELRVSIAKVERGFMRRLNVIQGQLFILIKYFMTHKFNVDIFAFKSYHAKTLLFHVLERINITAQWTPENLVDLLIQSFELLVDFINECGSLSRDSAGYYAAMKSFFLDNCFIYYHKKIITDQPHSLLVNVISEAKNHIHANLEEYMQLLKPLRPNEDGLIFHPYMLFPIRLTLQFYKPLNPNNLYVLLHSCLQEVTVLKSEKKTEFLHHVDSLPPKAFTASLCLKVMTHLKLGDTKAAVVLLTKHQYHDAQYQLPLLSSTQNLSEPELADKLTENLSTADSAWCFAFTYDQMKPLNFSFLGDPDVYDHCILVSRTYPVDVVVDFNCLVRVFYHLLCPANDQKILKSWRNALLLKKAPLSEVYLCHWFSTQSGSDAINQTIFNTLNQYIMDGASDRMFIKRLIKLFRTRNNEESILQMKAFCEWVQDNLQSVHFTCLYSACKVPLDLLSSINPGLLWQVVQRADEITTKSLPYQDYELLLKMRRRLCQLDSKYLLDWQNRLRQLKKSGKLNVQEIFAYLKSAGGCKSSENSKFALNLLRESPKAISYLKLRDFRLLAQEQRNCAKLDHGYIEGWLSDIRSRIDDLPADKAPFLIVELVCLIDCLRPGDTDHADRCMKLLGKLAKSALSKSDAAKVDRLQFSVANIR